MVGYHTQKVYFHELYFIIIHHNVAFIGYITLHITCYQ